MLLLRPSPPSLYSSRAVTRPPAAKHPAFAWPGRRCRVNPHRHRFPPSCTQTKPRHRHRHPSRPIHNCIHSGTRARLRRESANSNLARNGHATIPRPPPRRSPELVPALSYRNNAATGATARILAVPRRQTSRRSHAAAPHRMSIGIVRGRTSPRPCVASWHGRLRVPGAHPSDVQGPAAGASFCLFPPWLITHRFRITSRLSRPGRRGARSLPDAMPRRLSMATRTALGLHGTSCDRSVSVCGHARAWPDVALRWRGACASVV